jgi:CheY-like chemotaxis protein
MSVRTAPSGRILDAWLSATRQELTAPAEALVRTAQIWQQALPPDAPMKLVEAANHVVRRSQQLLDLIPNFIRPSQPLQPDEERSLRHDLRGHAAYVIGMAHLWRKQLSKLALDRFDSILERLEQTAHHIVTILDRMASFQQADPGSDDSVPIAELMRLMEELPASQERGHILVVDDNPFNRQYLQELLTQQGHQVTTAADGESALRLLNERPIDLILLDVLMPGISGFGLLERVKSSSRWRHIPVVMVSSLEEQRSVVNCIARGAEDYLTRPVDPLLLRARIGASLEKKRLRDREVSYLQRIDQLLHALFPAPVVAEVRETSTVRPRRHEKVGVLFADVVGFTAYCDQHREWPEWVVESLQRHYLAFERIAQSHGVQKIKTVGDAFMGTAGLLTPHHNPVRVLVECGLEMIASARANSPSWDLRVGIHVGPVVAGVVGETQFSFDLWGDTVNTAARMESASEPGRITLSPEAWYDIADLANAESATVEIRGKGKMQVYRFLHFTF